jgi:ABC-type Zn uptake system ZnuABC Zn-binding protein ZnuA
MTRCLKGLAWLAGVAGLGVLLLPGCGGAPDPWAKFEGGPPRVIASFPPLYCFARNVAGANQDQGGIDAAVLSLLTTVGPHEFHADSGDLLKFQKADLFLINGLGLDESLARLVTDNHLKVKVVEAGEAIPEDELIRRGKEEQEEHEHGKGGHEHGQFDPHVWLGIPEAIHMVEHIRDVLAEQDPAHKDAYARRAREYVGQLRELHEYGKKSLGGKKNRKIIATHESLGYFARAFGLEVLGHIQPQPGTEADATGLQKLVDLCAREKVRVITVEPQYSTATAETLGRQLHGRNVDVHLVEVDTIETADPPIAADYYVCKMRQNIDALAKHLE